MQSIFEQIIQLLNDANAEYTLTSHPPVHTSEEAARIRGVALKTGAKSMVVKADDTFYLLILPGDKKIIWKEVKDILHAKNVRFATGEEATNVTQVEMGSVPPFGNIMHLETYMDTGLLEEKIINFNPGSLTRSISMKSKDLVTLTNPVLASFC